jgi:hypothetical protein
MENEKGNAHHRFASLDLPQIPHFRRSTELKRQTSHRTECHSAKPCTISIQIKRIARHEDHTFSMTPNCRRARTFFPPPLVTRCERLSFRADSFRLPWPPSSDKVVASPVGSSDKGCSIQQVPRSAVNED